MKRIQLATTGDGAETIFRVKSASSSDETVSVEIIWLVNNQSLGPEGWGNTPYSFSASCTPDGNDLLVTLDADITNYIEPGMGIEISVPALDVRESFPWPAVLPIFDPASASPSPPPPEPPPPPPPPEPPPPPPPPEPPPRDDDVVQRLQAEVTELRTQLDTRNDELKRCNEEFRAAAEKLKQAETPDQAQDSPRAGRSWWKVLAALSVGLVVGLGTAMLAKDWLDPPTTLSQSDIERLRKEAYAPLIGDLTNVSRRSPNGTLPDQVAQRGLPADSVHVLDDRARAFLNHGIGTSRDGNKSEAVYWYKQALRLCASDAMLYLGDAYLNGDGARHDARTGFQLMRVSGALGSRRAIDTIKAILRKGEQVPLAPPNFSELYQGTRR